MDVEFDAISPSLILLQYDLSVSKANVIGDEWITVSYRWMKELIKKRTLGPDS